MKFRDGKQRRFFKDITFTDPASFNLLEFYGTKFNKSIQYFKLNNYSISKIPRTTLDIREFSKTTGIWKEISKNEAKQICSEIK